MSLETTKENIRNEVLRKIEAGKVQMRPRYYFIVKLCLSMFVCFLVFLFSTLLISYIIFTVRAGGEISLLSFGTKGLYHFFLALPWFLLIITTILLLILDWLLKSWSFGYKSPIVYLFLGSLVLITILGTFINLTSFHSKLMYRAEEKHLPFGADFYAGIRKSHRSIGIFRGEVLSISGQTLVIKHNDYENDGIDQIINVVMPSSFDLRSVKVGDLILVAGDVVNNDIMAYGMRELTR